MTCARQVLLKLDSRAVSVPGDAEADPEVLRYSGISVVRCEGGEPVEGTWVPLGPEPSYADDEALIAAWHAAIHWSSTAAGS